MIDHLAACDRPGDGRADYSQKHHRHGENVQVVSDPARRLPWISPELPGRAHDLTAARPTGSSGSANATVSPSSPTAPTWQLARG
ncbi:MULTISPECIES: transposase family protein [unclassified Streptomyces]|uniref:transposase family protein n=1 Tax=unclassified Streptomyces TaxID=2593676 RepID=UPI003FA37328